MMVNNSIWKEATMIFLAKTIVEN